MKFKNQKAIYAWRKALIYEKGYLSLRYDLKPAVEKQLKEPVDYNLLGKVLRGERGPGPLARKIRRAISRLLGKPEGHLWPEVVGDRWQWRKRLP